MPRIPIHPVIAWRTLFDHALPWSTWIETGEKPEHRAELVASYERFTPSDMAITQLAALPQTVHALAIAEPWCGDVRRHIPVLQRLAGVGERLQVRFIGRHDGLEAFERHLTNGGEAIPKVIFLNAGFVETGNWGPLPASGRRLIARGKAANDHAGARRLVQSQYGADPQRREVERELLELIDIASAIQVADTPRVDLANVATGLNALAVSAPLHPGG